MFWYNSCFDLLFCDHWCTNGCQHGIKIWGKPEMQHCVFVSVFFIYMLQFQFFTAKCYCWKMVVVVVLKSAVNPSNLASYAIFDKFVSSNSFICILDTLQTLVIGRANDSHYKGKATSSGLFLKKKKSVSNILMSENIFFKKRKKQVSRLLL